MTSRCLPLDRLLPLTKTKILIFKLIQFDEKCSPIMLLRFVLWIVTGQLNFFLKKPVKILLRFPDSSNPSRWPLAFVRLDCPRNNSWMSSILHNWMRSKKETISVLYSNVKVTECKAFIALFCCFPQSVSNLESLATKQYFPVALFSYYAVQSGSNFWVCWWNPKVWLFRRKLLIEPVLSCRAVYFAAWSHPQVVDWILACDPRTTLSLTTALGIQWYLILALIILQSVLLSGSF